MTFTETFRIHALWPRRPETPESIAQRIKVFLAYSKAVLPDGKRWYGVQSAISCLDVDAEPDKIEPYVAASISRDEDGTPEAVYGYHPTLVTFKGNPPDADIDSRITIDAGASLQLNSFKLATDSQYEDKTDPRLVTYEAMRTMMLAAAFSFQPDWCQAGPTRLADYYDREGYVRPAMGLDWMIWFCPALAPLIKPPKYSYPIIEHFPDGSLFLATSKETFDCGKSTHLAQARAIHRQIDPLNYTLPFEGRSGRSDRVPPFPKL